MPSCLRLFSHWLRAAASRTFCTAGSNRPMRMAMMAITTNNSISVKPGRVRILFGVIVALPQKGLKRSVEEFLVTDGSAEFKRRQFVLLCLHLGMEHRVV